MISISILIIIMAIALPSFKNHLSPILLTRISSITLLYSGALAFNALYIQSIGSGIGIYSGLFHVTIVSQQLDIFLLIIGALILIPRPGIIEFIKVVAQQIPTYRYQDRLAQDMAVVGSLSPQSAPNRGCDSGSAALANTEAAAALKRGLGSSLFTSIKNISSPTKIINTELVSGLGDKYSLIILFSTLGSSLLLSSSDLLSMYLSIELQSFGVYILSTLFRDSRLATSAGLKYFLLGGLASCLILLGSGIVYFYTGLTNLESIYSLISTSNSQSIIIPPHCDSHIYMSEGVGLTLGFIITVIGFLIKVAAAPLHNWSPDVYDDSPTIVTIWLTIMPKIAILIFLLDISMGVQTLSSSNVASHSTPPHVFGLGLLDFQLQNLLLLTSLFSLIIGTVVGLAQSKIKRLLAYSTISHTGFMLLALSINSEQSIESFIFYIIQYSLTNLNTFLIILALGYLNFVTKFNSNKKSFRYGAYSETKNIENMDIRFITELKGQFLTNPLLSLSLAICLFSMAGIPPLMGFFAKQTVLYSALQSGYYFMSIVAIIVSVISASYYLKIVRILFTTSESTANHKTQEITHLPIINNTINLELGLLSSENPNKKGVNDNYVYYPISDPSSTPKWGRGGIANIPFVSVNDNYYVSYFITNIHSFLISTLSLVILLFILKPSLLLNSTQLLSLSLFYC